MNGTPLPNHQGFREATDALGRPVEGFPTATTVRSGPHVQATMSMDELAKAQAQITAVVKERDDLLKMLAQESSEHNRTKDRLLLVQNELEKAQADANMWMRVATKFATLIKSIYMLAGEAKAVADAAAREGQMEGETATEVESAANVAKQFAPRAPYSGTGWDDGR